MIQSKSVLAVITARGGSKRVRGKNIRVIAGRPMIAWAIEAAAAATTVDRAVVSTDDEEIAATARAHGGDVPFMRPAELASDTARVEDSLIHALESLERSFDYLVLLPPTSPMVTGADIDGCVEACVRAQAPAAVTVCRMHPHPFYAHHIDESGTLSRLHPEGARYYRNQDMPQFVTPNGAVLVAEVGRFLDSPGFFVDGTVGYRMPEERSLDVNTEFDLTIVDAVMRQVTADAPGRGVADEAAE